ncbi:hypothetical protein Tco_1412231 [Tanacetum coccineum]
MALSPRDQRHLWLRYQVEGYTEEIVYDFEKRLETIFGRQGNRVHILYFEGLTSNMRQDLADRLRMVYIGDDCHEEMAEDEFGAYWLGSKRVIPGKGDLSDYWVKISSGKNFLRGAPSYTYIRGPVRRLMDREAANVPYLLAQYLFRHTEGRKSGAKLSGGHFIRLLSHHFGLVCDDGLRGLSVVTSEIPLIDMGEFADPAPIQAPQPPPPPPATCKTMTKRLGRLKEEMQGLQQDVRSLHRIMERSMTDQGRFSKWMISCMAQLMKASG